MTGCSNAAADPSAVLTYNITNLRGWNDPPSSVFSPGTSANRKRIDLKKRVAHNLHGGAASPQTVGGVPAANIGVQSNGGLSTNVSSDRSYYPPQSTSFAPSSYDHVNHALQNLHVNPPAMNNTLPHATSNPDLSRQPFASAPQIHHAASVPFNMNTEGDATLQNGYFTPPLQTDNTVSEQHHGTITSPFPTSNKNYHVKGTLTPPANISDQERKYSAPNALTTGPPGSIFDKAATPVLQTSHKRNNLHTNIYSETYNSYIPNSQPSSLPPMLTPNNQSNNFNRSNSTPNVPQRKSPTTVPLVPPPTQGFYTKKLDTSYSPKSISPGSSGKNSPVPPIPPIQNECLENENELLESTLKTLTDCKSKCACHLTNKVSDDITKRLNAFQSKWKDCKLSNPVKIHMSNLAQALEKSDFVRADSIHKLLIIEYSGEVMPWMVGIKKLITTYQHAVMENNQFE